jgi:hypothetical protein
MLRFASTRTPLVSFTTCHAMASGSDAVLTPAAPEVASAAPGLNAPTLPQVSQAARQSYLRRGLHAEQLNVALGMWPASALPPHIPLAQQLMGHALTTMDRCKLRRLTQPWHPLRHVLGATVDGRTLRGIGRKLTKAGTGLERSNRVRLEVLLHGLTNLLPDPLDKKRLQKVFMRGLFLAENPGFERKLAAITGDVYLDYPGAKKILDDGAQELTPMLILALAQIACAEKAEMPAEQEIAVLQAAIAELETYYAQQIAFLNSAGSASSALSEQEKECKLKEFFQLDLRHFHELKQRLMARLCLLENMQNFGSEPAQLMALCRGVLVDRWLTLPAESATHPDYRQEVARVISGASARRETDAASAA